MLLQRTILPRSLKGWERAGLGDCDTVRIRCRVANAYDAAAAAEGYQAAAGDREDCTTAHKAGKGGPRLAQGTLASLGDASAGSEQAGRTCLCRGRRTAMYYLGLEVRRRGNHDILR